MKGVGNRHFGTKTDIEEYIEGKSSIEDSTPPWRCLCFRYLAVRRKKERREEESQSKYNQGLGLGGFRDAEE